jgi:hypothetical protein
VAGQRRRLDVPGEIEITAGQNTIEPSTPTLATRWIYGERPDLVQYFTFNAPVGAPEDSSAAASSTPTSTCRPATTPARAPSPTGCTTTDLSPQEKVLIFMLFELSSCLIPDDSGPATAPAPTI